MFLEKAFIGDGSETGLHGKLVYGGKEYESIVIYRFDDKMTAIQADLIMSKHYAFMLKVGDCRCTIY